MVKEPCSPTQPRHHSLSPVPLVGLPARLPTRTEGSQVVLEDDLALFSGDRGVGGDVTGFCDVQCTGELKVRPNRSCRRATPHRLVPDI